MKILVIADHHQGELKIETLKTINAAAQIGSDIDVLVAGFDIQAVSEQTQKAAGVSRVITANNEIYAHLLPENMSKLIHSMAGDYSHILAPATANGKNIMPRVAALLDVCQISDISAVIDADTFKRPIYAGNVIATVKSSDSVKVITVRASSFDSVGADNDAEMVNLDAVFENTQSNFVKEEVTESERPELTAASAIISGGRGMQNGDNFSLLEGIADKLGAAIGASRAAVDAGFVPNDMQVGQTGKIVAPDLYIAVGISGAIQHLAGMKDSKVIVAINKDEEAPIFQVADYGLVADLFTALPELESAL